MVDILHRVGIKSSPDDVYKALTTREGLAAWWTNDTQGESKVGGVLQFRFSADGAEIGGFDMKVLELDPAKRVLWQVVDGPEEWIGTKDQLRSQAGRRLCHRPLQAPGLEGAGGIHAPLQHQVGDLSDEPEVAPRNRERRPQPERRQDRQLELDAPQCLPDCMDIDKVFKALADPTRRRLLDLLHRENGQTLTALCEHMDMTRQAVTQHLQQLEEANLVAIVWHGREKLHYLNPVPLHEIYERWIEKFERSRLGALRDLKKRLEGDDDDKT